MNRLYIAVMSAVLMLIILFMLLYTSPVSAKNTAVSGSDSVSQAGASITFDDHSDTRVDDRTFVNPTPPVTAHTQPLFHKGEGSDISFRPAHELLKFGNVFSKSALLNLARGGSVDMNFATVAEAMASNVYGNDQWIMIVIGPAGPAGFSMTSIVDAEVSNKTTTSFQMIAKVALRAIANGDNTLYLNYEGYKDKVFASGWGVGTHTTTGTMAGNSSTVGGGGLGFSSNKVGVESLPWIRGYSGSVPALDVTKSGFHGKTSSSYSSKPTVDREGR